MKMKVEYKIKSLCLRLEFNLALKLNFETNLASFRIRLKYELYLYSKICYGS